MGKLESPANTPVWVDYERCKSCDICVEVCPSGTLAMRVEVNSIQGCRVSKKVSSAAACATMWPCTAPTTT